MKEAKIEAAKDEQMEVRMEDEISANSRAPVDGLTAMFVNRAEPGKRLTWGYDNKLHYLDDGQWDVTSNYWTLLKVTPKHPHYNQEGMKEKAWTISDTYSKSPQNLEYINRFAYNRKTKKPEFTTNVLHPIVKFYNWGDDLWEFEGDRVNGYKILSIRNGRCPVYWEGGELKCQLPGQPAPAEDKILWFLQTLPEDKIVDNFEHPKHPAKPDDKDIGKRVELPETGDRKGVLIYSTKYPTRSLGVKAGRVEAYENKLNTPDQYWNLGDKEPSVRFIRSWFLGPESLGVYAHGEENKLFFGANEDKRQMGGFWKFDMQPDKTYKVTNVWTKCRLHISDEGGSEKLACSPPTSDLDGDGWEILQGAPKDLHAVAAAKE